MRTLKTPTLLLLCPLLAGLQFAPPGPTVANGFATDVEVAVTLTDGTVRRSTYIPCESHRIFESMEPFPRRTVFVERLTVVKDDAVIGDYEGAKVEALGASGGFALFDESGLRRWTGNWFCARTPEDAAVPTRLTISHDGKVIHDLDEPTFRSKFRLHLQAVRAMTYAIRESEIAGVQGVASPKRCAQPRE